MSSLNPTIPSLIHPVVPTSVPFVYRDGLTMLQLIECIKHNLDSLQEYVNGVMDDVNAALEDQTTQNQDTLNKAQQAAQDAADAIQQAQDALDQYQQIVTNVNTALNTANAAIDRLEALGVTDPEAATELKKTIEQTTTNLTTLEQRMTTAEGTLSDVQSLTQTNQSNIAGIDANLNALHANSVEDATTLYNRIMYGYSQNTTLFPWISWKPMSENEWNLTCQSCTYFENGGSEYLAVSLCDLRAPGTHQQAPGTHQTTIQLINLTTKGIQSTIAVTGTKTGSHMNMMCNDGSYIYIGDYGQPVRRLDMSTLAVLETYESEDLYGISAMEYVPEDECFYAIRNPRNSATDQFVKISNDLTTVTVIKTATSITSSLNQDFVYYNGYFIGFGSRNPHTAIVLDKNGNYMPNINIRATWQHVLDEPESGFVRNGVFYILDGMTRTGYCVMYTTIGDAPYSAGSSVTNIVDFTQGLIFNDPNSSNIFTQNYTNQFRAPFVNPDRRNFVVSIIGNMAFWGDYEISLFAPDLEITLQCSDNVTLTNLVILAMNLYIHGTDATHRFTFKYSTEGMKLAAARLILTRCVLHENMIISAGAGLINNCELNGVDLAGGAIVCPTSTNTGDLGSGTFSISPGGSAGRVITGVRQHVNP